MWITFVHKIVQYQNTLHSFAKQLQTLQKPNTMFKSILDLSNLPYMSIAIAFMLLSIYLIKKETVKH